jgi:hypothetical protein
MRDLYPLHILTTLLLASGGFKKKTTNHHCDEQQLGRFLKELLEQRMECGKPFKRMNAYSLIKLRPFGSDDDYHQLRRRKTSFVPLRPGKFKEMARNHLRFVSKPLAA